MIIFYKNLGEIKLMKLNSILYCGTIFLFIGSTVFSLSTKYDEDFEAAYTQGKTNNLVHYVQQLSTPNQSDDEDIKNKKCDALKYFLSTGGKQDFRQSPATAQEYRILMNALIFITILHEELKQYERPLNLSQTREIYKKPLDQKLYNHFITAQKIISSTAITFNILNDFFHLDVYIKDFYECKKSSHPLLKPIGHFFSRIRNYYHIYLHGIKKSPDDSKSDKEYFDLFVEGINFKTINDINDKINLINPKKQSGVIYENEIFKTVLEVPALEKDSVWELLTPQAVMPEY